MKLNTRLPPELIERMQRATTAASKTGITTDWHKTVIAALERRCLIIEALAGHKIEQAGAERLGLPHQEK